MSGHSHWAGIKHKKEITDQKRGQVFSKLLQAISAAARAEPNPDFNPRLRSAIEKAGENNVPAENIKRAIKKAAESGASAEELIFEAYGPGGAAIIIEAISDSRNRAVAEIKKILSDFEGKWAETGSVRWAFDQTNSGWVAKFPQDIPTDDENKLKTLINALETHDDVQKVHSNIKPKI